MLRRVCLLAVLFIVLAGFALQWNVVTIAQTGSTPCDYVVRFMILNRPQEIQESDIPWLANLPDFGSGTIDAIRALIRSNGPINDPAQLDSLPSANVSGKMKILMRTFFNLGGKDTCQLNI